MIDLDLSGLLSPAGTPAAARVPADGVGILTVCTGNICRSPLAEHVLQARLRRHDVVVASAGTHALVGEGMTPQAAALAVGHGGGAEAVSAHAARWLREEHLRTPVLVLAMTREHRRAVVELDPSRTRSTFAAREFARLSAPVSDDELRAAADAGGDVPGARVAAAVALIAARRGIAEPPADPAEDDVIDPYRRSQRTYDLSAAQLLPALDEVTRVVRAALA